MNLRKRLFAARPAKPPGYPLPAPIRPRQPLYVIGDIHGCTDLTKRLLTQIDRDIQATNCVDPHLVFVGDYIDRGEDSFGTLRLLMELQGNLPKRITCLLGNHEKMLLDFLDHPVERGNRWLHYGGLQTLASFRIGGLTETASPTQLEAARSQLLFALPKGTEEWLRSLPLTWISGNICVTHAGADPVLPISQQDPNGLLWGPRNFLKTPRKDALWIVHGHTIVNTPEARDSRISVDTGACYTGRLTAAVLDHEAVRFLEVH